MVINNDGAILKSTLTNNKDTSENYANIIADIVDKTKLALKDKDYVNDELSFLKIRTKKLEFIIVPGQYHFFFFDFIKHSH